MQPVQSRIQFLTAETMGPRKKAVWKGGCN